MIMTVKALILNNQLDSTGQKKKRKEYIDKGEYIFGGVGNKSKYDGYKHYLSRAKGIPVGDLWLDIEPLSSGQNSEFEDYPTQKPTPLLTRIINCASNEKDIIADFYMGGGTTILTAANLNRFAIGCDINFRAIQITKDRLLRHNHKNIKINGIPKSSYDLDLLLKRKIWNERQLQEFTVKYLLEGLNNTKYSGDGSIDGTFSFLDQNNHPVIGIIQVTKTATINHLKSFILEVKHINTIGIYISFERSITSGMRYYCKREGLYQGVDKVQILSYEDLMNNNINSYKVTILK